MEIKWDLKVALVNHYGSQILASRHLKIPEGRLSKLIRGHVTPTEKERKALKRVLGKENV